MVTNSLALFEQAAQEKAPAWGRPGLTDRRRGASGDAGKPSIRNHVDGGFAVGCSSFTPRIAAICKLADYVIGDGVPLSFVNPSFRPRMIFRDRMSP